MSLPILGQGDSWVTFTPCEKSHDSDYRVRAWVGSLQQFEDQFAIYPCRPQSAIYTVLLSQMEGSFVFVGLASNFILCALPFFRMNFYHAHDYDIAQ